MLYHIISIHAARVGCDCSASNITIFTSNFNPRSPSGLRLYGRTDIAKYDIDFNPRSPSGLRLNLLADGLPSKSNFNPRSPSGLRLAIRPALLCLQAFQSTQPEWAATHCAYCHCLNDIHFNPRSPSGLRRKKKKTFTENLQISIHAARVGCDRALRSRIL